MGKKKVILKRESKAPKRVQLPIRAVQKSCNKKREKHSSQIIKPLKKGRDGMESKQPRFPLPFRSWNLKPPCLKHDSQKAHAES